MTRVQALTLPAVDRFAEPQDDALPPRPAVAGGSDRRPPGDGKPEGRVIPFPRERVRPAGSPAGETPMWPAWMAHVLTRYRTPEGGGGGGHPSGVFI